MLAAQAHGLDLVACAERCDDLGYAPPCGLAADSTTAELAAVAKLTSAEATSAGARRDRRTTSTAERRCHDAIRAKDGRRIIPDPGTPRWLQGTALGRSIFSRARSVQKARASSFAQARYGAAPSGETRGDRLGGEHGGIDARAVERRPGEVNRVGA